ncbi:MAG: DUF3881 family protein [Acidobacteriota bacterium]
MPEPFDAIGFKVPDEAAYHALAEEAHQRGAVSQTRRDRATLHGCCWRLGEGLEVWTVLHESKDGVFYADCRPAYRGRHLYALYPWEIMEYEEDGEAVVRGIVTGGDVEVIFELQNLTEIHPGRFRERPITAVISGLAYHARLNRRRLAPYLRPLAYKTSRRNVAENDYEVRGEIIHWRQLRNPRTTSDLILVYIDTGGIKIEVLVSRADLDGELRRGAQISAEVWLQGHILSESELEARYEGIDGDIPRSDFWTSLKRAN